MGWTLTAEVIEDPDISQDITYYELTDTVNKDGRSIPKFAPPQTIRGLVRPKDALPFELGEAGQEDATDRYLFVGGHHGVANDDRIVFRGDAYRATEQQINFDGVAGPPDEFSLFALVEDSRDQDSDSSTEGPDDDTGSNPGGDDNFEPI